VFQRKDKYYSCGKRCSQAWKRLRHHGNTAVAIAGPQCRVPPKSVSCGGDRSIRETLETLEETVFPRKDNYYSCEKCCCQAWKRLRRHGNTAVAMGVFRIELHGVAALHNMEITVTPCGNTISLAEYTLCNWVNTCGTVQPPWKHVLHHRMSLTCVWSGVSPSVAVTGSDRNALENSGKIAATREITITTAQHIGCTVATPHQLRICAKAPEQETERLLAVTDQTLTRNFDAMFVSNIPIEQKNPRLHWTFNF
jgi:hypothetical protein